MRKWVLTFLIVIYAALHSPAAIAAAQTAGELVLPDQKAIQNASIVSETLPVGSPIVVLSRTDNRQVIQVTGAIYGELSDCP